jgi:transposase
MTMQRVEVITSAERRRQWTRQDKDRLVAVSLGRGVTASEVARSAGIHASQLFRWQKELCGAAKSRSELLPVEIVPAPAAPVAESADPQTTGKHHQQCGLIEIDLGDGRRVRVDCKVDARALKWVLDALVCR